MNYKYYLKVGINSRNSVVYVKKKEKKKKKVHLKNSLIGFSTKHLTVQWKSTELIISETWF